MESDHYDGVGFGATRDDGVFIEREILVHAYAGNVFEQLEVLFERFNHRFDDDGHNHQRQIGAFRLGFVDFIHVFHLTLYVRVVLLRFQPTVRGILCHGKLFAR